MAKTGAADGLPLFAGTGDLLAGSITYPRRERAERAGSTCLHGSCILASFFVK